MWGVECLGLIDSDILGEFDLIIDAIHNAVLFFKGPFPCSAQSVPLDFMMRGPILSFTIGHNTYRLFLILELR